MVRTTMLELTRDCVSKIRDGLDQNQEVVVLGGVVRCRAVSQWTRSLVDTGFEDPSRVKVEFHADLDSKVLGHHRELFADALRRRYVCYVFSNSNLMFLPLNVPFFPAALTGLFSSLCGVHRRRSSTAAWKLR